jgi:hypothetical protein
MGDEGWWGDEADAGSARSGSTENVPMTMTITLL